MQPGRIPRLAVGAAAALAFTSGLYAIGAHAGVAREPRVVVDALGSPDSSPPEPLVLVTPSEGDAAIVPPPDFGGAPTRRGRLAPLHPALPGEGGVWAVVVGVDDYPGTEHDLRAAVADARDVEAALAAYGVGPERRRVLLDGSATLDNVYAALGWLVDHAGPDATAVFFFSGHVRRMLGDPDGDGEAVDEAMVTADGGLLYDGDLAVLLSSLRALRAWLSVAGCYGAGFDDAVTAGRVLTAAAAEEELAYENITLGRSYLVEYTIRRAMLEGNSRESVQAAFQWGASSVAGEYPNRVPVMVDRAVGPLALASNGAFPPPPAPASAPAAQPREPETSPSSEPPWSRGRDRGDGPTDAGWPVVLRWDGDDRDDDRDDDHDDGHDDEGRGDSHERDD